MGKILLGAITPHPPIIIEAVGGSERLRADTTIRGLKELAEELAALNPATLVFISPHAPVFQDAIVILGGKSLAGSFSSFNAPQVKMEFANDLELARGVAAAAKERDIFAMVAERDEARQIGVRLELDHGVMVPLDYFRQAGFKGQVVVMGMAMFPIDKLYEFGMAIQQVIEASTKTVAVIASGDLSHRLTPEAPAGYNMRGQEFDHALVDFIKRGDFAAIMDMDHNLVEAAGECGYRPINVLLGVLDGYKVESRVYSYEGPYGVGYLTASLKPLGKTLSPGQLLEEFRKRRSERIAAARAEQHPIVKLAVASLEHYLRTGEYLKEYDPLPGDLPKRAGVFVSIKEHGQLRGCIGTIQPTQPTLAQEVINNAVSAGTQDPRFYPIELSELPELTFSVDVLAEEEEIPGPESLDPSRYGVIVRKGSRSGLLLPNLEGIDTVEEQLAIARRKAGIGSTEEVKLSRFEVARFT